MKHKILKISPFMFLSMCKEDTINVRVVANILPKDAKFIRAYTDDYTGWGYISLIIESESFEEIKEGDVIPILPYPIFEKIYT